MTATPSAAPVRDAASLDDPSPAFVRLAMTTGSSPAPVPGSMTGGGSRAGVLPVELVALEAATRAAVAAVDGAGQWDAGTRAAVLTWVGKHRDQVALLEARVLTAERAAGSWSLRGDRDLAGFVGRQSRQGRGAGMAAVAQAATLEAMPQVADALVDGPVTAGHLAAITKATATSPLLAEQLATADGQARVVELAARLDGAEFGKVLQQQAASLDPASRQRSHDEQRANRSLTYVHTPSGTMVKALLDAVAGHKFATMIDALCPRPAADDERSRPMRQADALMAGVERVLSDKATVPDATAPVQAIITFEQATWTALRAGRCAGVGAGGAAEIGDEPEDARDVNRRPGAGSADEVAGRLTGVPTVTDESGRPWPASEVARALCDCALTAAVLGAPGEDLQLGRSSRLFGRQHWKALYAVGVRTCQMAGCGMPLAYCELHHIRWWDRDGGRTDLANCAAYCSFHHHEIHRRDLRITRNTDGSIDHHYPDGRPYGAPTGDNGAHCSAGSSDAKSPRGAW